MAMALLPMEGYEITDSHRQIRSKKSISLCQMTFFYKYAENKNINYLTSNYIYNYYPTYSFINMQTG